jgi:hypothetical protein
MENTKLTRKQLYDLVWKEPRTTISKRFQITDAELRKICGNMNIPLPPNGHWQKLKYRKPVEITKLPGDYSGSDEVVFGNTGNFQLSVSPVSIQNSLVKEIESNPALPLLVPDRLFKPDILITSTQNYLDAIRRYDWSKGGTYPSRSNALSIDVSKEQLPRTLRIMNAIIRLFNARGHSIIIKDNNSYAVVFGEEIMIRLRERHKRVVSNEKYREWESMPIGKLVFIAGENWRSIEVNEGLEGLEKKLAIILAKIEIRAKKEIADRIEREKWHLIQEEKRKKERELTEKKEKELTDFKNIFWSAIRLNQAGFLRDYVNQVEAYAKNSGVFTEEKQQWIAWAREKIDWYDPLVNKEDQLLDDFNKNKLMRELLSGQEEKSSTTPWMSAHYY